MGKKYRDNPPEYGTYYDQPQAVPGFSKMDLIMARFQKKPVQEYEDDN